MNNRVAWLELALRTSSANYDQNKDNLCVALLPYDLIFQMGKILSIYTSEEQVREWGHNYWARPLRTYREKDELLTKSSNLEL